MTDMGEKKAPGRFTIHFNLKDPHQRKVSELLEQQGRRKAQFLTNAVLCYIQEQQSHKETPTGVSEDALEQMVLSILKKHPQFKATEQKSKLDPVKAPSEPPTEADDDTAFQAITNTLAAFQKG